MSAPTPTARSTPAGIPLDDGHSTLYTFEADPDVSLWEKTVTPPGVDNGEPIETSTMHNDGYVTFAPQALKTLTQGAFVAAYDPGVLTQIMALCGVKTTITITYPDGTTWAFFGYLQKFEPQEVQRGQQPTATVTIQPTNVDPVARTEEGPAVASVTGT